MTAGREAQRELDQRLAAARRSQRATQVVQECQEALETETDPARRATLEDWVVEVQAIVDGNAELAESGARRIRGYIGRMQ